MNLFHYSKRIFTQTDCCGIFFLMVIPQPLIYSGTALFKNINRVEVFNFNLKMFQPIIYIREIMQKNE